MRADGSRVSYFEKDAIISGIGISRIGRRTGIPDTDLTLESCRAAIADAGLTLADIDGMATLGDVPFDETAAALGIEVADRTSGIQHRGVDEPGDVGLPSRLRGDGRATCWCIAPSRCSVAP